MKPWYKRKTYYAGVALIITGIGQIVAEGDISNGIRTIAEGATLIFLRSAVEHVG